jgi:tetratricopeptide (TPR) repeat protein
VEKIMGPMHDRIFISYRRDDARGASGRLYDWLRIAFGRDKVFRDVASIGAGKWRDKIDAALAASAVCLPVIGPRWCDDTNGPRLQEEDDMVRHELVSALARSNDGLTLIPALVEGARLPPRKKLPVELLGLLDWNAYPLSEEGWEDDVRRLLAAVSDSSGQAVAGDVDTLLVRTGEAEARMRILEQEKHLQADQIRALTDTLTALTRQMAESPESRRADLAAALAALGRGDTSAAEAEFERVLEERGAAAESAAHEAAEAARNIANLALLSDIDKAVRYYRRASELEPERAETWGLLGHACLTAGDTNAAQDALSRALRQAQKMGDIRVEMAAMVGLGDVATALGDLADASGHYIAAMKLAAALAARDPANTQWQRDLSVSHERIGDVLVAQGDGAGALAAYRNSLTIAEALAARDPANTQWQRDLSVSHERIGDVLVAQGDGAGALAAYRKGLAIREALAARDPANAQWQVDVAVSCAKLGTLGQVGEDARRAYLRRGLAILRALKEAGRLAPAQDWTGWFGETLRGLNEAGPKP